MAEKLKGFPVGEQLYIFCAGQRPNVATTRDVIISAHGGFARSTESFRLPKWVRALYLYGPHGAVLMDPGIAGLSNEIHAFEVKRGGDMVQNYELSKYQGSHNTSGDETYESITKLVGTRAISAHEWESQRHQLDAINQKKAALGARVGAAHQGYTAKLRELKAAKLGNTLPAAASDPGPEDFEAIRAAVIADIQRQAVEMKQVVDERQAELEKYEKSVSGLRNLKQQADRRARVHEAGSGDTEDVLKVYDVLTIRNRRFRKDATLKSVLDALYTAGVPYPRIHCSFCRSPMDRSSRHEKKWEPAWNTDIKR